ncbi:hypothetical protein HHUSO_G21337 [Huso huso]|uniref:Polo-like kinase 1 substrate 1 n=1 Tax=Huso huso TaxID=61971 RepID=A0ABR0YZ68_HUSHU
MLLSSIRPYPSQQCTPDKLSPSKRVKNEKTFLVKPKELWRNSEDSDLGTDPSPRPPHTEPAGGGDEFDDFYD